jgi:NTE family protein
MSSKVGLVLSGGGARGLAHVGVLKVLEKEKIKIDAVAGCSAGSIIGALYASGKKAKEIEDFILGNNFRLISNLILSRVGLKKNTTLEQLIEQFINIKKFEDLKLPLYISATNITKGKEVIFSKGNLLKSIKASISIPGVTLPVKIEDNYYIDGAILNQNPFSVFPKEIKKYIIINVTRPIRMEQQEQVRTITIMKASIRMMQDEITKLKLQNLNKGNYVLIKPDVSEYNLFENKKHLLKEMILKGEVEAQMKTEKVKSLINK